MKKIIVIGCPGSGKSHFSRELNKITDIDLYHLDMMYWNADKSTVDRSIFLQRLTDALNKEAWIIDGNYTSTMELRMSRCDTVFFLDLPVEVCLDGVASRRGKPRTDMPWIEVDEDTEFTDFIKKFNEQEAPRARALIEKYKDTKKIIIFKSREEADSFLTDLKEEKI